MKLNLPRLQNPEKQHLTYCRLWWNAPKSTLLTVGKQRKPKSQYSQSSSPPQRPERDQATQRKKERESEWARKKGEEKITQQTSPIHLRRCDGQRGTVTAVKSHSNAVVFSTWTQWLHSQKCLTCLDFFCPHQCSHLSTGPSWDESSCPSPPSSAICLLSQKAYFALSKKTRKKYM